MNRLNAFTAVTLIAGLLALAGCSASARVSGEEHSAGASGSVRTDPGRVSGSASAH